MPESWKSRGTFLVLLALQAGPKHGYEIGAYLRDRSGGFFSLSFGALYPILHRLEKEGLILGAWDGEHGPKPRKVYALTRVGEAALGEERAHYHELVGAFERLLGAKA